VKDWLAGCLLKTITGNQRGDAEVPELIDRFPEATSWERHAGAQQPRLPGWSPALPG
jgi:hypothetical protein